MRRAFGDEPVDQRGREIQEGAAIVEVHGTKPEAPGPQPGRLADANRIVPACARIYGREAADSILEMAEMSANESVLANGGNERRRFGFSDQINKSRRGV